MDDAITVHDVLVWVGFPVVAVILLLGIGAVVLYALAMTTKDDPNWK
jgi:hypothetical protein